MPEPSMYLGDGVTATSDGFQMWLSTPRGDGEHRIALDPSTWAALKRFAVQAGFEED